MYNTAIGDFSIRERGNRKTAVFIHKIPPIWERKFATILNQDEMELNNIKIPMVRNIDNIFVDYFLSNDIYFSLLSHLIKLCNIEEVHVVFGFQEEERRNWRVLTRDGFIPINENTYLWRVSKVEDIMAFCGSDLYFFRGVYPNTHSALLRRSGPATMSLYYPATALHYPYYDIFLSQLENRIETDDTDGYLSEFQRQLGLLIEIIPQGDMNQLKKRLEIIQSGLSINEDLVRLKNKEEMVQLINEIRTIIMRLRLRKSKINYSIVLCDELENIQDMKRKFQKSHIQLFQKPVSSSINVTNTGNREFDFIYVATPMQTTKNHHILMDFIEYIERNEITLKLLYVGDTGEKEDLTKILTNEYQYIEIESYDHVEIRELCLLFNKAKNQLITSGRDCNPRVISEGLCCGCYTIALDILSDGLSFFNQFSDLGVIIKTSHAQPIYTRRNSISIVPNDEIFNEILTIAMKKRNHINIGRLTKEILSIENALDWEFIKESYFAAQSSH